MPIRIITISRLFGAGGASLAAALGQRLGWQVMDRRLINEVARRLDRPEEDIVEYEERWLSTWERAMAFASNAFPEMPIPPLQTYMTARVPEAAESILTQMADHEPLVVVGHGTQCIFRNRPDALHLRLIAPREQRTRTAMQRLGITRDEASDACGKWMPIDTISSARCTASKAQTPTCTTSSSTRARFRRMKRPNS